jgi:hypothetical protein
MLGESPPLLVREAGVQPVRRRVGQIDLLMRYIQVAAKHNGLAPVQPPNVGSEISVPPLPVRQT